MAQDTVDAAMLTLKSDQRVPSIEALNSEWPHQDFPKDKGKRILRTFLSRLRLKKSASANISKPDPTYRVVYLGNVLTGIPKGEGSFEKALTKLWRTYTHSSRPDVRMELSVTNGGLRATTKAHGLTEYWAHRLTNCVAPLQFPRLFCWIYRHEKRIRHELRCHAVLCSSAAVARQIEAQLKEALTLALSEFKKDKISKQNARLSLINSLYENPTIPRRKILLSTGSQNYRPPLERSKSAPKLTSIEESLLEEDEEPVVESKKNTFKKILRHYDSTSALLDKRKSYVRRLQKICSSSETLVPGSENSDEDKSCNEYLGEIPDDKSDIILDELVRSSMSNDILETCEKAWFNAIGDNASLVLPLDSDEGSLSSGCESASTVTSETEQPIFPISEDETEMINEKKTEIEFKVGGPVLDRIRHLDNYKHLDLYKFCHLNNSRNNFVGIDEVSLVPVGEVQSDFSSLKVFKRRSSMDAKCEGEMKESEEDAASACSDESGYEEEEVASSVANIILI